MDAQDHESAFKFAVGWNIRDRNRPLGQAPEGVGRARGKMLLGPRRRLCDVSSQGGVGPCRGWLLGLVMVAYRWRRVQVSMELGVRSPSSARSLRRRCQRCQADKRRGAGWSRPNAGIRRPAIDSSRPVSQWSDSDRSVGTLSTSVRPSLCDRGKACRTLGW
jgi:hypothetical protein